MTGSFFVASKPSVYDTLGLGGHTSMSDSLHDLEARRAELALDISRLGDLRPGSITTTTGRAREPDPDQVRSYPQRNPAIRWWMVHGLEKQVSLS